MVHSQNLARPRVWNPFPSAHNSRRERDDNGADCTRPESFVPVAVTRNVAACKTGAGRAWTEAAINVKPSAANMPKNFIFDP
jgi:hypothetical protein